MKAYIDTCLAERCEDVEMVGEKERKKERRSGREKERDKGGEILKLIKDVVGYGKARSAKIKKVTVFLQCHHPKHVCGERAFPVPYLLKTLNSSTIVNFRAWYQHTVLMPIPIPILKIMYTDVQYNTTRRKKHG